VNGSETFGSMKDKIIFDLPNVSFSKGIFSVEFISKEVHCQSIVI
jgi:hypothetical protein